jgi:hypothetical protein
MNYNNPNTKNSTVTAKVMCAIVFCTFSFAYLYFYQADLLAVCQHVLSNGATRYDALIGAILITLCLQLLQVGIFAISGLTKRTHALTYLPSFLVLAIITDVCYDANHAFSFSNWWWISLLFLGIWGGVVYLSKVLLPYEPVSVSKGLFSRLMWINLFVMILMMFLVGMVGNDNAIFHYRMKAENSLLKGDYDGALHAGINSLESDRNLFMIRVYALSRKDILAETLFSYPVAGSSNDMIPTDGGAQCLMYPNDSIYRYLGAKPLPGMKTIHYLKSALRSKQATPAAKDYLLCAYLVDKKIDDFVHALTAYYPIDEHLPRHYREALILYTHLRSNPVIVYNENVMDADFRDLQGLEKRYADDNVRKTAVYKQFGNTYWYYYKYK